MRKLLFVFCLLLTTSKLFAQEFSQYNTGTLYDSFENPSQRTFIPDSSKQYAFNFLAPNLDLNFSLSGDAQQTLKNRQFKNAYQNSALKIGLGNHFNYVNVNASVYSLMFKMFTSLAGDEEIGFFTQSKADARGVFTDETIGLLNGSVNFPKDSYTNVFNSRYNLQTYNEMGFTYREQITKRFALGIKIASVWGMYTNNVKINQSSITFDKAADTASLRLAGTERQAGFTARPFSNPGLDFSIGTTYRTRDGFIMQTNIKDLGFIHWNKMAETYDFNSVQSIYDLTSRTRESDVFNSFRDGITAGTRVVKAFTTPLDGRAELSASKMFWLNQDDGITYSPTLIASKELFYNGFTGALVSPVQYKNYIVSIVTAYNDMHQFDFGGQFMVKSANAEFFIGSDRITQGTGLLIDQIKGNKSQIGNNGSFTGGDITIGFSMKFGPLIEHPMNASFIPMGTKGFLGRMWDKLFKPDDTKALQE